MKVFKEHGHQILAQVHISHRCQSAMFRKDLQNHFASQMTFASLRMASSPTIMSKQRLKMFWDDTKRSIEAAGLLQ